LKWAVAAAVVVVGLGIWLVTHFMLPASATAVPVLTPGGGTYAAAQPVTISDATPNAVIHYTVDGSSPTETSAIYREPVTSLPSGAVVRAMAKAEGYGPSSDVTAVYIWSGAGTDGATKFTGGTAFEQGKSAYDHKQYAQARTLFGPLCADGDQKSCNYLGYLYAQGLGGVRDQAKARTIWASACERENMLSCANLGSLYQDGGNNADARKYFQKACDGKLTAGCDLLRGVE
jgi:TPR repeat protein